MGILYHIYTRHLRVLATVVLATMWKCHICDVTGAAALNLAGGNLTHDLRILPWLSQIIQHR